MICEYLSRSVYRSFKLRNNINNDFICIVADRHSIEAVTIIAYNSGYRWKGGSIPTETMKSILEGALLVIDVKAKQLSWTLGFYGTALTLAQFITSYCEVGHD